MHKCGCWDLGLRPGMTWDELIEEIVRPENYCTSIKQRSNGRPQAGQHIGWICPTLDRELKRADAERTRLKYYRKKKKQEGYTDEQLSTMKPRRKGRQDAHAVELDLHMFYEPKDTRPKRRRIVAK